MTENRRNKVVAAAVWVAATGSVIWGPGAQAQVSVSVDTSKSCQGWWIEELGKAGDDYLAACPTKSGAYAHGDCVIDVPPAHAGADRPYYTFRIGGLQSYRIEVAADGRVSYSTAGGAVPPAQDALQPGAGSVTFKTRRVNMSAASVDGAPLAVQWTIEADAKCAADIKNGAPVDPKNAARRWVVEGALFQLFAGYSLGAAPVNGAAILRIGADGLLRRVFWNSPAGEFPERLDWVHILYADGVNRIRMNSSLFATCAALGQDAPAGVCAP